MAEKLFHLIEGASSDKRITRHSPNNANLYIPVGEYNLHASVNLHHDTNEVSLKRPITIYQNMGGHGPELYEKHVYARFHQTPHKHIARLSTLFLVLTHDSIVIDSKVLAGMNKRTHLQRIQREGIYEVFNWHDVLASELSQ